MTSGQKTSLLPILFLVATCVSPVTVHGQVKDWSLDGLGNWSHAGNWLQNSAPAITDIVRIGSIPDVGNASVMLDVNSVIQGLALTNTNKLNTSNSQLIVNGNTHVSGATELSGTFDRSWLTIDNGLNAIDFQSDNLTVSDNARVRLHGRAHITERLTINQDSFFEGDGAVNFSGTGVVLRNNELVHAFRSSNPFGMTFNVLNGGLVDLDGTTGDGRLKAVSSIPDDPSRSRFTINGGHMADPFSGLITIEREGEIDLNFESAWVADQNSTISFNGPPADVSQAGVLRGADVTLEGGVNVSGQTNGLIENNATFAPTANVNIGVGFGNGGGLVVAGESMVNGGDFSIGEDAELVFDGFTRIEGGTFNTFSNLSSEGRVVFRGLTTEWAGQVDINGNAQQVGDAKVVGPTTIDAGVFDMDGLGNSAWRIDSSLTINADSIDSTISNSFDGLISIGSVLGSQLSVNLNDPTAHWTMAGTMALQNNFPFERTMVAGDSRIRITGDLAIAGANNRITADLDLVAGSHTIGQTGDAGLVVQGRTLIESGAEFTILKTLVNGQGGELSLADGVSLDDTDLINQALLSIGESSELTGIADVASFESTEDATWLVDIGGYLSGNEFDVLLVTDEATILDGILEVELIDTGNGLFAPEVGDEFTILTSLSGVFGEFDNTPISHSNGYEYQWEVLYNPHDITLRVSSVSVPEPAAASICFLSVLGLMVWRRKPAASACA